jgi:purine-binding chemotaxis protein CheW
MSAAALAWPGDQEPAKALCFLLRGQALALPVSAVKETLTARPLTRVPFAPPALAGLINLRGDVVAVLSLARILEGLLGPGPGDGSGEGRRGRHIVLLRGAGPGARCGLLVDQLTATLRLDPGDIRPAPSTLPEAAAACVRGVTRVPGEGDQAGVTRLLWLLDPERLLQAESLGPYRRRL